MELVLKAPSVKNEAGKCAQIPLVIYDDVDPDSAAVAQVLTEAYRLLRAFVAEAELAGQVSE